MAETLSETIRRMELALETDETLSIAEKNQARLWMLETKVAACISGSRPADWMDVGPEDIARIEVGDVLTSDTEYRLVDAVDRDAGRIRIKRAD